MKALLLRGRPGGSSIVLSTWPWERVEFRYEDATTGDIRQRDAEILALAKETQPDVIISVVICPRQRQLSGQEPNEGIPLYSTFRRLRDFAPSIHVCLDGGDVGWRLPLLYYAERECFDAHVNIDGVRDWPLAMHKNCAVELAPVAFPTDLPVLPLAGRRVDFGFNGATGEGTRRWKLCKELERTAGLTWLERVCYSKGTCIDYREYCQRLTCMKIALNMAWSGNETVKHVKARVSEAALAGCCLLETAGSCTRDWFEPGHDYVEYESPEDAAAKVRVLLGDLPRAQVVTDMHRRKVIEQHNPAAFWTRVLSLVGLKAPEELQQC